MIANNNCLLLEFIYTVYQNDIHLILDKTQNLA